MHNPMCFWVYIERHQNYNFILKQLEFIYINNDNKIM